MSFWQRLRLAILNFLDQVFMVLGLPTFTNNRTGRLRRLRWLYYHNPKVSIDHSDVRSILHGHIDKRYRSLYDRLLLTERAVYVGTGRLPDGARGDELLLETQHLGDRIALMIDDLQQIEIMLRQNRDPASPEAHRLARERDDLRQRIDRALDIQASIPERISSLGAIREERELNRLADRIERLTNFLDDVEASYAELDQYKFDEEQVRD